MNSHPILIAEDNDTLASVILKQLKLLGLSAHVAMNGEQAVNKAQQYCYGLILMDVSMPVLDGLTATQYIRANGASKNSPIIGVTGQANREECLGSGMNDFALKPLTLKVLNEIIQKWHTPCKQQELILH